MGQMLSTKLRLARPDVYMHWCPGCKSAHFIYTAPQKEGGPAWSFNGDVEAPTFGPSVHIWYDEPQCSEDEADEILLKRSRGESVDCVFKRITVCHYFLTGGILQYCPDSGHNLRGQNVPLPDYPVDNVRPAIYDDC